MRLLEYMSYEGGNRSKAISEREARNLILKKYNNALDAAQKGSCIWRGNRKLDKEYYFIDPRMSLDKRVSPWAYKNYYNLLISNLPSWNKYPKRNKSIIATTDIDDASSRAGIDGAVLVLPKNGSKIGVCPTEDIWYSFSNTHGDLNDFNKELHIIFRSGFGGRPNFKSTEHQYSVFLETCDMIDENKKDIMKNMNKGEFKNLFYFHEYFKHDNEKLIDYIDNILNPDKNDFSLITAGDLIKNGNYEVWTDGPSILIKEKSFLADEFGIKT